MMFFDQVLVFWRNLTKKESVESAKYDIQFFLILTVLTVFGRFFHGSVSCFFWLGSEFLADPDSGKKRSGQKDSVPQH